MTTIYVDDQMPLVGKFRDYCHMWTDGDIDALIAFALRLGLRADWLQHSKGLSGDFYHFDISPRKRLLALKLGAQYMPLRQWIARRLAERNS